MNLQREMAAVPFNETPAEMFPTKHTNISSEAAVAGEAWFADGGKAVTINAASARFGHRAGGASGEQYDRAAAFFRALGYAVVQIPYGECGYER